MRKRTFTAALAILLTVSVAVPSIFLVAPQKAYAAVPVGVPTVETNPILIGTEIKTTVESTISAVKNSLSWALDVTNTAAGYAQMINTYVLQPLAFVLSGNLMKMLTTGVINFVIGKANGTGVPQFAVDVQRSMQTVADGRALAYLRQINQTNSPFSSSIRSALATDYLTKSSLAGFWAANMNTLARSSPNVPAFLAGNWSQGGIAAWFALTTQVQNNPYSLYQNTQSQLGNLIGPGSGGATGARAQELAWGNGFMSWCGSTDTSNTITSVNCTGNQVYDSDTGTCVQSVLGSNTVGTSAAPVSNPAGKFFDSFGNPYLTQAEANAADTRASAVSTVANLQSGMTAKGGVGINPGDPCNKADGTPGTIQTPGSTIKATLDKVLGGQQDQIARMGNVGGQINQILGNIGTVMQTVQFASQILGGGNSGGLLAVNSTSNARAISQLAQFTPVQNSSGNFTTGYLGATQSDINAVGTSMAAAATANAAAGASEAAVAVSASASGDDLASRITAYESAWRTIKTSAERASTSVTDLVSFCTASIANTPGASPTFISTATAQTAVARSTLATEIAPVLAQAATASTTIAAARATLLATQVATTTEAMATSSVNVLALQNTSPTVNEVLYAEQNAHAYGVPPRNPDGTPNTSLIITSSASIVDKMNNISTNAQALKNSACTPYFDFQGL